MRVINADVNGAGGSTVAPNFGSVGELNVVNGAAQAVYEIVDASPTNQESAQIPAFIGIAAVSNGGSVVTHQDVLLGPVSTVATASATALYLDLPQLLRPATAPFSTTVMALTSPSSLLIRHP